MQFADRHLLIPVSAVKDSVLCQVAAIHGMLKDTSGLLQNFLLFAYKGDTGYTFLTHGSFQLMLSTVLTDHECGYPPPPTQDYIGHSFHWGMWIPRFPPPQDYTGHSFHWGGAPFGLTCRVLTHTI